MIKHFKDKNKKKFRNFCFIFTNFFNCNLATSYYNNSKKKIYENYKTIINNVYLKKTLRSCI